MQFNFYRNLCAWHAILFFSALANASLEEMIISLYVKVDNMSENSQNICKSVFQVGPNGTI